MYDLGRVEVCRQGAKVTDSERTHWDALIQRAYIGDLTGRSGRRLNVRRLLDSVRVVQERLDVGALSPGWMRLHDDRVWWRVDSTAVTAVDLEMSVRVDDGLRGDVVDEGLHAVDDTADLEVRHVFGLETKRS